MAIERELLHRAAFSALIEEGMRPQRWASRSEFASKVGITPSMVSMLVKGDRDMTDRVEQLVLGETGWPHEALLLPVKAVPGDLETARLLTMTKRLNEQVSEAIMRGTDEIAEAIRQRNGG